MSKISIDWVVECIADDVDRDGVSETLLTDPMKDGFSQIFLKLQDRGYHMQILTEPGFQTLVVTK